MSFSLFQRLRSWFRRWVDRSDRARRRARLLEIHRQVQEAFPGTPWVVGGRWSWYSDRLDDPVVPSVLVMYQYLPLAVVDREDVRIREAAKRYGIAVFTVDGTDAELSQLLESLRDRAIRMS